MLLWYLLVCWTSGTSSTTLHMGMSKRPTTTKTTPVEGQFSRLSEIEMVLKVVDRYSQARDAISDNVTLPFFRK